MINYNDGAWHTWSGDECPVHPKSAVHVALRSGLISKMSTIAGSWYWGHNGTFGEIISFRVITPYIGQSTELAEPVKRRVIYVINSVTFETKRAAKTAYPGCKPAKFKECKK